MRFIHTADIHIDSPLTGLSAYSDAPLETLRSATRDAFTELINQAISLQVDFMIIAGDCYDGVWKDHNTGIYFCKEMGRLKKAGIPVYLLYGNHDAENEMTSKLSYPDNVHIFGTRKPVTFNIDGLKVALHGWSFKEKATTDNLVTFYPSPVAGLFNIGVLHTALEGNAAHATYAPCTVDELLAKGYQYWALGHVHEFQVWNGKTTIVFPGSLQGRHIRETGPHGAVLVTTDESGVQSVDRLYVDVLRWQLLEVNVSACASLAEVVQTVGKGLEQTAKNAEKPTSVRVVLTGKTSAHGELFGMERQLRAEITAITAAIGSDRIWVEKVQVTTTQADQDEQAIKARADALSDLQCFLEAAERDPEFLKSLQGDLLQLVTKAPLELQSAVPYFKDIRAGDLTGLVRDVRPGLLAYLSKKG